MDRPFERVYTVNEFWDGPRAGFTEFNGAPHVYRSLFRDDPGSRDPDDRFLLRPITAQVLALALEDWEIWLRWAAAYVAGTADASSHPALPADAARHREIEPVIEKVLEDAGNAHLLASAEFRLSPGGVSVSGLPGTHELEVRWTPAAAEPDSTVGD